MLLWNALGVSRSLDSSGADRMLGILSMLVGHMYGDVVPLFVHSFVLLEGIFVETIDVILCQAIVTRC